MSFLDWEHQDKEGTRKGRGRKAVVKCAPDLDDATPENVILACFEMSERREMSLFTLGSNEEVVCCGWENAEKCHFCRF
jgi:hypothetical protein